MEVVEIPESLTGLSVQTQDTEIEDAEGLQFSQFRLILHIAYQNQSTLNQLKPGGILHCKFIDPLG